MILIGLGSSHNPSPIKQDQLKILNIDPDCFKKLKMTIDV